MKLKIAGPAAERLVSLSTRAPVIHLTGAEIAVLLGSLDDVDRACVEVLKRITGVEATEKRLEEVIKVLLTDLKIERKADLLAGKVMDRLKKLWILRTVHSRRALSIPKGWVSIRITRDSSFLLFAGRDLKRWLKKKKDTIFVSGTALGYAYCKSRSDDAIRMALEIAKELSVENPLTPLKDWHFECVHPNELEMCEACLTGRGRGRKWVKAGKLAVNLYRLYQTEAGRAALYLIRKNMCRLGGEEDERRLKAIKNNAIRNAEKRIDELKAEISPLEISRLPEKDDSVSFINYPEHAIRKGKICGLALGIAASWYGEDDSDSDDCEAVDAVLRAIMDLRHVITPDVRDALRLLAERVKERNKALYEATSHR